MSVSVLVVDDEKEILNAVGNYLQLEGFRVSTAGNGAEAISQLDVGQFDIVITDLMMPVKDGFELLAHIVANKPGLPAIVMTANATPESDAALKKLGVGGYLKKPFDLLSLTDHIMGGLASKEKGFMQGVTLPSFLQLLEMEAKTCTLKVTSGQNTGYLYFEKGVVYEAKTDNTSGVEALKEILMWDDTSIEINHINLKKKKQINVPLQHVLLDTLRIKDETGKHDASNKGEEEVTPPPASSAIKKPKKETSQVVLGRYFRFGKGKSMVIPAGAPILKNMNTYYLHIPKLIEFFTQSPITGLVRFRAAQTEGFVLFGETQMESAFLVSGKESFVGAEAVERIGEMAEKVNMGVDIEQVPKNMYAYWASLAHTTVIHKDLDSGFTSLQKLISKLTDEKLTGYIDVTVAKTDERGAIFFNGGKIVGGAFSWEDQNIRDNAESLAALIDKSQQNGATFSVHSTKVASEGTQTRLSTTSMVAPKAMLAMLTDLLKVVEVVVEKETQEDFMRALKRKFVEKADTYPYLDPFAGEFSYDDGVIEYDSDTPVGEMCGGLVDCLSELADDMEITAEVKASVATLVKKHPTAINTCAQALL